MKILWVLEKYFDIALDKSARLEMIETLTRNGHEVILLTGYKKNKRYFGLHNRIKYLPSIKIRCFHFLTLSISIFLYTIILIIRWNPSVILCCSLSVFPLTFIRFIARILCRKTKFIADIRSIPVEVKSITSKLSECIFVLNIFLAKYFFDGVTVISPFMRKHVAEKYHIKEITIGIWSSGVNIEHFDPIKLDQHKISVLKRELNLQDKFVVMYHGVLTPNRGLQETITAINLLHNSYKDIVFLILGDGVAKPILQRLISDYQVNSVVRLIGVVPHNEIPYYLSVCDVGILPFPNLIWWRVSSPIKLMEYLAMGKPIIVTDIEAHRDVISSQKCGFTIPNNEPTEIRKAIMKAYKAYKLRGKLLSYGRIGRDIARKRYTWQSQAAALENYLCTLI